MFVKCFLNLTIENLSLVKLDSHLLSLGVKLGLVLLQLRQLHLQLLDHVLGLGETSLQLELSHLELLSLGHAINLILLSPHVSISLGLDTLSGDILLGSNFFIMSLLQTVKLMLQVAVLAEQRNSLLCLVVSNILSFIKSRGKTCSSLGQESSIVLELLQQED